MLVFVSVARVCFICSNTVRSYRSVRSCSLRMRESHMLEYRRSCSLLTLESHMLGYRMLVFVAYARVRCVCSKAICANTVCPCSLRMLESHMVKYRMLVLVRMLEFTVYARKPYVRIPLLVLACSFRVVRILFRYPFFECVLETTSRTPNSCSHVLRTMYMPCDASYVWTSCSGKQIYVAFYSPHVNTRCPQLSVTPTPMYQYIQSINIHRHTSRVTRCKHKIERIGPIELRVRYTLCVSKGQLLVGLNERHHTAE